MILRHIIHDRSDAEAIQILRNCRGAISDAGKPLLVEFVIKPSNQPDFVRWLDLNMLALLTGHERTKEDSGISMPQQGTMMEPRSAGIRRHDDRRIVWRSSANTP